MRYFHTLCILFILLIAPKASQAQQVIPGGPISGIWSGSIILANDGEVPSGDSLTILPGTHVRVAQGVTLKVTGKLIAIGDSMDYIVFDSPTDSTFFNTILIQSSTSESQFRFVEFRRARTGISLDIASSRGASLHASIQDSRFIDIEKHAIWGRSHGFADCLHASGAFLHASIERNMFYKTGNGIYIETSGTSIFCGGPPVVSRGYAEPEINNNLFYSLDGTAFTGQSSSYSERSYATFRNNSVVESFRGVNVGSSFDASITNNAFYKNRIGAERSGNLSLDLTYNSFFMNDSTDFINYPDTFGRRDFLNRNGVPSDASMNIFDDPLFQDLASFAPREESPLIDAGKIDSITTDLPGPVPHGDPLIPDIGYTGGFYTFLDIRATSIDMMLPQQSSSVILTGNYPNPFSTSTKILFTLTRASRVSLVVIDILGREVGLLINNKQLNSGRHELLFDASSLPSGVYLYRIDAGGVVATRTMLFVN